MRNTRRRRGTLVIEIDEYVIDDDRHWTVCLDMLLDAGEAQCQKKLIARAVRKARDFDVLVGLAAHRLQDRLAPGVVVDFETGKCGE